jgi:hypothetical protein
VECGDAGDGVVDRSFAASALAEDLVVLESGDGVFGSGPAFPKSAMVPVSGDAAVGALVGWADARVSAVASVTGQSGVVRECLAGGFAVDHGVVAVAGPRFAGGDGPAVPGPAGDLRVDAAPVVLALRGPVLVVGGDEGAVDDPRFAPVRRWRAGQRGEAVDDAVYGGVGDVEECRELLPREVRAGGQGE